jgi:phage terminase small subunit
MSTMHPRRDRFAAEYLKDLNATEAAKRCGYAPRGAHVTGCRLLKDPNIARQIAEAREAVQAETMTDVQWVVTNLRSIAEKCMTKTHWNPAAANKSLELLGKHLGAFVEKHEHTGKDGAPLLPQKVTVELISP